jgi:hypothetical protein
VTFEEFERAAWADWERIPAEFKAGVDGLLIERSATPHPELPDVYTLGECLTESYPSALGDADTIRSRVVLYYGSFFRLSRLDPGFDWQGELWETLTHELQHHLESLVDDDALGDMDYAADQNYRRQQGDPFDPFFFREGLPEDGWLRVEDEYFLEVAAPPSPPEPPGGEGSDVRFAWEGVEWVVALPALTADVTLVLVHGANEPPPLLNLAVVRRRGGGFVGTIRRLLRPEPPTVAELELVARRA